MKETNRGQSARHLKTEWAAKWSFFLLNLIATVVPSIPTSVTIVEQQVVNPLEQVDGNMLALVQGEAMKEMTSEEIISALKQDPISLEDAAEHFIEEEERNRENEKILEERITREGKIFDGGKPNT